MGFDAVLGDEGHGDAEGPDELQPGPDRCQVTSGSQTTFGGHREEAAASHGHVGEAGQPCEPPVGVEPVALGEAAVVGRPEPVAGAAGSRPELGWSVSPMAIPAVAILRVAAHSTPDR